MCETKVLFTVSEDEKLVEMVAKFPAIYDSTSPIYKDQNIKDNCWKEIADFVGRSAQDSKKRWRNIKDTYLKRQRKGKSSGSSAVSKGKKWPLADMLVFLSKVECKRPSISNIEDPYTSTKNEDYDTQESTAMEEDETTNEIEQVDIAALSPEPVCELNEENNAAVEPPLRRPRKHKFNDKLLQLMNSRSLERQKIIESLKSNDDDVDLFFKSIAMSVKKLTPDLIKEAKMKTLQMVFDLESQNTALTSANMSYVTSLSSTSNIHYYVEEETQ